MNEFEWFDNLYKGDIKKVLHTVSGGTDSALTLFIHCKYIVDNNLSTEIHTYNDCDTNCPPTPKLAFLEIFKYIKNKFPSVKFYDPVTKDLDYSLEHFGKIRKTYENSYMTTNSIDFKIGGVTMSPPEDIRIMYQMDDTVTAGRNNPRYHLPFTHVNKKEIARLYKKYDLMDMFLLTESCIGAREKDINIGYGYGPCKKCWWCREKYWAFNCFDFGVTYD